MAYGFLDIALTPSVKTVQEQMNADRIWSDFRGHRAFDRFSDNVAGYIAERDSFYFATVSETGWPYVQYRGGPRGFLRVLDARTLAFADYRGNRQYISTGNVSADDRACLLLPRGDGGETVPSLDGRLWRDLLGVCGGGPASGDETAPTAGKTRKNGG